MRRLRRIAISGLVIVGPLALVLIAVAILIRNIAGLSFVAGIEPAFLRPIIVLVLFGVVVLAVGYMMRTAMGVLLVGWVTSGINHVPVLRVVYNASQLAVETILSQETDQAEPVLVEAWDGLRVTAFYTGKHTADGRMICFFPTAPNVTTGYVIEVRDEDVTPTGESVEHALTRLLSAGFGGNREELVTEMSADRAAQRVSGVELPDGMT